MKINTFIDNLFFLTFHIGVSKMSDTSTVHGLNILYLSHGTVVPQ